MRRQAGFQFRLAVGTIVETLAARARCAATVRSMQRKIIPEMLDQDLGTPAEVAASLADLAHINDWFGGTGTTIGLVRHVAEQSGDRSLALLEVGSGKGHVALETRRRLAEEGLDIHVTLLDRMGSHLPDKSSQSVCGDALRLPFGDNTFDLVSCSLFAHHLEPDDLRNFANEGLRVCRRAVAINDLIRSRLHLGLVYAGLPLFRSRITWHDAPASVRRAYTVREMRSILEGSLARAVTVRRRYLYRMGVLLWK